MKHFIVVKQVILKSALTVIFIILMASSVTNDIMASENTASGTIGNYEEWTDIPITGDGIRITDENGAIIVLIDKFGGIYLNGDLYINSKKYGDNTIQKENDENFNVIIIYLMQIVLFVLCFINLCKNKIFKGELHE